LAAVASQVAIASATRSCRDNVMTRKPEHPNQLLRKPEGLQDDLQAIADQVPAHQYGHATAREFAIGKYSDKRPRRRYALT
jgi:hypothetical protein